MKSVLAEVNIQCSSRSVIQAFTDFEMLKAWWNVERCLIEKRPGGLYILTWNISTTGFGYVSSGIIQKYDPDKLLKISNMAYLNPDRKILGPMNLDVIASSQNPNQTRLKIIQDGYQSGPDWDWYYEAVKSAWPAVLEDLKKYLEKMA